MLNEKQLDLLWQVFKTKENEQYGYLFKKDVKAYGELGAIYNLGFLAGWDDARKKKGI